MDNPHLTKDTNSEKNYSIIVDTHMCHKVVMIIKIFGFSASHVAMA